MAAVAVVILCHGDDQVEQLEALPQEAFSGAGLVVVVLSQGRVPVVQFPAMVIRPTHRVTGFNAGANRDEGLARALCRISVVVPPKRAARKSHRQSRARIWFS